MLRIVIPGFIMILMMTGCSSLRTLNTSGNSRPIAGPGQTKTGQQATSERKFLEEISVSAGPYMDKKSGTTEKMTRKEAQASTNAYLNRTPSAEKATVLQLKYAILLNTEVELVQDSELLEHIDEWYGTKYRYGGSSKSGIDCSAFVQAVYLSAFAITLPRTAREQYHTARIVSATELKTGDLVFFNTTGGISHVGIYLQNNKFAHASTAYGVTISDMFDPYYMRRFIGVGRLERPGVKLN